MTRSATLRDHPNGDQHIVHAVRFTKLLDADAGGYFVGVVGAL